MGNAVIVEASICLFETNNLYICNRVKTKIYDYLRSGMSICSHWKPGKNTLNSAFGHLLHQPELPHWATPCFYPHTFLSSFFVGIFLLFFLLICSFTQSICFLLMNTNRTLMKVWLIKHWLSSASTPNLGHCASLQVIKVSSLLPQPNC